MAENKKPISIDYDVVDNATDAEVEALVDQYSRGDEEAIKAVELYDEAAKKGDASARRLKERFNQIARTKNADFIKGIHDKDPEALKNVQRIIKKYESGSLTPGEQQFILDYTTPAEEDIDRFLNEIIADPDARNKFLENLTPAKVKKLLPSYEMNPQKEEALAYTLEETKALRSGSDKEKALAKAARRKRAKSFLSSLTIGDFIAITKKGVPEESEDEAPRVTVSRVDKYRITKDRLTKAAFYNLTDPLTKVKKGLCLNNENSELLPVEMWKIGSRNNKKQVTVYANMYVPNKEDLAAAGISIGQTLSIRARLMYGAFLSLQLAGNNVFSIGMIGKIIFGTRYSNDLTEKQKKYIEDGITELFSIMININTTITDEENGLISLLDAQGVNLKYKGPFYPGEIKSAYINGALVESAVEVFKLPILYRIQDSLKSPQILNIPMKIYNIPGRIDIDTAIIRQILLDRIDYIKHGGNSDLIDYDKLLEALEIDPTDREQRERKRRIRKKVEHILDYWKTEGFISDYKELTKSNDPAKGTAPIKNLKVMM